MSKSSTKIEEWSLSESQWAQLQKYAPTTQSSGSDSTHASEEATEKEAVDGVSPKPHASEEASTDVDEHMKPSAESKNEEEAPEEDSTAVELNEDVVQDAVAYENDPRLDASSGEALDDASNSDGCNGPDGHLIDHRNESKQQWDGTSTNLIFVM